MAEYDDIYAYINFETAKSMFEINDEISGYIQLTYFIPIFRNMYIRYID